MSRFFFSSIRRPPSAPPTYPLLPSTTLFRSVVDHQPGVVAEGRAQRPQVRQVAVGAEADLQLEGAEAVREAAGRQLLRLLRVQAAGIHRDLGIGAAEQPPQRLAGHPARQVPERSEEHTSELQSLMRISYAVFCLKKKN